MPPPTAHLKAGETDIFKLDSTDICTLGLHQEAAEWRLWKIGIRKLGNYRSAREMKPTIDPHVRDKLHEIGIVAVKNKLLWIMNVRSLGDLEKREEDLGDGVMASPREMQQWVNEKEREAWLEKWGKRIWPVTIMFSFLTLVVSGYTVYLILHSNRPILFFAGGSFGGSPVYFMAQLGNSGKSWALRGTLSLFNVSDDGNHYVETMEILNSNKSSTITPTGGNNTGWVQILVDQSKLSGLFLACIKYHDERNHSYKDKFLLRLHAPFHDNVAVSFDELPSENQVCPRIAVRQ